MVTKGFTRKSNGFTTVKMLPVFFLACFAPSLANATTAMYPLPLPEVTTVSTPLNAFIHQVLENNPAIQAAKANVEATRARQTAAAKPLYNPELTGEAQQALENTYSLGINQTVDWANKRAARAQVGSANVAVAKAELASLRQQLASEILNALASYHTNVRVVALTKERTQLLQQFTDLTKKLHASGDVARVDLDLAQLALSEALAQQTDAEVTLNQSSQTLMAITGLKKNHWPNFPKHLPKLQLAQGEKNDLLYRLPILKILNDQSISAQARIHLAEKQRYADPTVGVQGGYTNDGSAHQDLIGVTLNMPLNIRNPYRAEVTAANEDAIEVDQKRLNLIRQANAEIQISAENYQMLTKSVRQWQNISGKPLTDGMVLIERLWRAGELNTTEYLVQVKQRIDSQIAGAELKGHAWQAWTAWLKASGQSESWLKHSR